MGTSGLIKRGHDYSLDGVGIPSVTDIIREAGLLTGLFEGEQARRKAELGTMVHALLAAIDAGEMDAGGFEGMEEEGYIRAWMDFRAATGFTPSLIEHAFHSSLHGSIYAGTCDRTGELNGKRSVVEIKTSCGTHAWWGIQLAGYAMGLAQDGETLQRLAVRLDASGKWRAVPFDDPADYSCFGAAVCLNAWKRGKQ